WVLSGRTQHPRYPGSPSPVTASQARAASQGTVRFRTRAAYTLCRQPSRSGKHRSSAVFLTPAEPVCPATFVCLQIREEAQLH
ncbi:hypothetical protein LEMLEM_LOCUS341, partial [Lemmus lemmus]